MVKYRYLREGELEYFDLEFKQFLTVNSVYHEDWLELTKNYPQKALDLVGLFSNQILQTVYEKINYLEIRSNNFCDVLFFDLKEVNLIRLKSKIDSKINFSTIENIHSALKNNSNEIEFFKSVRKYKDTREIEIHYLIEKDAIPSTSDFWISLTDFLS